MAPAHQFVHMHAPAEPAHGAGQRDVCVAAAAPAANDEETRIESIK